MPAVCPTPVWPIQLACWHGCDSTTCWKTWSKTLALCDNWLTHPHAASFVFHGTDVVEVISTTRVSVPPLGTSTRSHGFTSEPEKQLSTKQLLPFYAPLPLRVLVENDHWSFCPPTALNTSPCDWTILVRQPSFLKMMTWLSVGTGRKQSVRDRLIILLLPIKSVSLCLLIMFVQVKDFSPRDLETSTNTPKTHQVYVKSDLEN